eukprot:1147825-Pelagomonas_calceolata.AAC.3
MTSLGCPFVRGVMGVAFFRTAAMHASSLRWLEIFRAESKSYSRAWAVAPAGLKIRIVDGCLLEEVRICCGIAQVDRGHDSGVSLVCSSDSDKRRDCAKLFMHFVLDRWGRGDVLT